MTGRIGRITRVAILAGILSFLLAAPAQATPIVVGTVTPIGLLFQYDYTIEFDPLDDEIAVLTINVLPNDASLAGLTAPAGFLILYSSAAGQGFVDLLPVVSFPLSGTLSGFSFVSAHASAPTTFDALTIFGGLLSGPTTGPLGSATPVPEPATWGLLAIGVGALGGRRALAKRRRSKG